MELDDLFGNVEIEVEVEGGAAFHVTYDPSRYSTEWHIKSFLRRVPYEELAEELAGMIVDWDLTRRGEAVAVTAEEIKRLPPAVMNAIHSEIQMRTMGLTREDLKKKETGTAPESGSRSSTS